ncbi:MBOAT family protein [Candidatus Woesearchaeota archaeon]|nr:MBOAT family protein [Candidatus Woesearchaeota archaeon]
MLLLISIVMDYYLGKIIALTKNDAKRKFYFIISLIANLGMLSIFKYTNFFIEIMNYSGAILKTGFSFPTLNIILPIGISFYTFESLSYTFDIYQRKLKPCKSLIDYAMFITFFPHLVAGPIVRARDFLPQLKKKISFIPENFKYGLTLVCWGLVKKVVFADNIAIFVNQFFADPTKFTGSVPIMLGALGFGIQIYCDFSGYSDIAIGLARILGIYIKINFDKPYLSLNVSEFWKRWHISLSTWLRDYLYISLGGNRNGKIMTYIYLMITMILGGLWHGAAWNFLVWGAYQGFLLAAHKLSQDLKINMLYWLGGVRKYLHLIITQYFVFLGWLIFRISKTEYLSYSIIKYITFDLTDVSAELSVLWTSYQLSFIFIILFIILHIYTIFNRDIFDKISSQDNFYWGIYLFLACLSLFFLAPTQANPFIYFQF